MDRAVVIRALREAYERQNFFFLHVWIFEHFQAVVVRCQQVGE
jgi:hypothetical protein